MTDQERLLEIQRRYERGERNFGDGSMLVSNEQVEWLIEKAKKAVEQNYEFGKTL